MKKEENILIRHLGKENHFQVPAGYFDLLADRVMAHLPSQNPIEQQVPAQEPRLINMSSTRTLWSNLTLRLSLRKIAAAVAAVAVLGGGSLAAFHYIQHTQGVSVAAHTAPVQNKAMVGSSEEATFNEMADYTMMDNETIYASLIAEN